MDAEYDFSQGKRGAVDTVAAGKTRITIRLDEEILAWFREPVHAAGGGNYQSLINAALRQYIQQQKPPKQFLETTPEATLETTLRRVLREELERANKIN